MTTPLIFKQYTWLIETIRKAHTISFKEICDEWLKTEMSGGFPLTRASFNRQRDAITDMFGVVIECNRRNDNRYFIVNESVLNENSVQNWMLSTFSVSNLLTENTRLYDRILLESIPSANEHLEQLLKAMRENREVVFTYRRYGASTYRQFKACPYCLKLYLRRWYVLMNVIHEDGTESYLMFSIDRFGELELSDNKFQLPKDFNAASFFEDCYGVVIGDGSKPITIKLRAFGREKFNLQDLPVHSTQKLITINDDYADFEVTLRPTADFKAFLTGRAEWLIVLSPKELAEEIQAWHKAAFDKYDNFFKNC